MLYNPQNGPKLEKKLDLGHVAAFSIDICPTPACQNNQHMILTNLNR